MKKFSLTAALVVMLLAAFASLGVIAPAAGMTGQGGEHTHTPEPTHTPHPAHTPEPPHTPEPAFTPSPQPAHTPHPTYTPHPTKTPHGKVKFEGIIESLPSESYTGEWTISGVTVIVDANTVIVPENVVPEVGDWAEVKATRQRDESLLAFHIRVVKPREKGVQPLEFKGVIESLPSEPHSGEWVISGITVTVDAETLIVPEGVEPEVGDLAKVLAFRQADGSLLAKKIKIHKPELGIEVEFEGVIESIPEDFLGQWVISGITVTVNISTTIQGTPQAGLTVEVEALIQVDGSVLATKIEVEEFEEVEFEGVIESIPETFFGQWVIGGVTVTVNESTFVDESKGVAQVGMWAEVKAVRQPDESLLAIRIKVERSRRGLPPGQ